MKRVLLLLAVTVISVTVAAAQSQVKKETVAEATGLGAISQTMRAFAPDYIQTHKK